MNLSEIMVVGIILIMKFEYYPCNNFENFPDKRTEYIEKFKLIIKMVLLVRIGRIQKTKELKRLKKIGKKR